MGISFTTTPDGKVRAAITGNTFTLLGKAGPLKDKFKGAKVWRWDGDKKQWYFDAESPDEAFEKISATRKAMGIAEGEYLVKPLEKPNTDAGVDIVAQTAHRSKGLEYDYVVLGEISRNQSRQKAKNCQKTTTRLTKLAKKMFACNMLRQPEQRKCLQLVL